MLGVLTGVEAAKASVPGGAAPPPPPPPGGTITVGTANIVLDTPTGLANTRLGMTSVHNQRRDATTKAYLASTSQIQNQHLLGFGAGIDPEVRITAASLAANVVTLTITVGTGWVAGQSIDVVGVGAPFDGTYTISTINAGKTSLTYAKTAANQTATISGYGSVARNWTFLDQTFGYPTQASGYFATGETCLTACGCPIYMRSPQAGLPWDPMGVRSGTNLTSTSDYSPPHSSHMPAYADLIAAAVARYTWLTYVQVWNEGKSLYFVTQYSGSNLVPTGSGLVANAGTSNRWWAEGYQYMYNLIWVRAKAVRSTIKIGGPYPVMNSFAWDNPSDQANDAFPDLLMGAWGFADKKVLSWLRYFIRYCTGCDFLLTDIRNPTKDATSGVYYAPASIPATPDPANKWLTNPEGGIHHSYWREGQVVGAWNAGQKQADFVKWVRDLGASSTVYQRPVCDARTIPCAWAEWYAYPQRSEFKAADPRTGNYWPSDPLSTPTDETAAFAWHYSYAVLCGSYYCMGWKPEGTVQGGENDPSDSNPLAIWTQYNVTAGGWTSLQTTPLKPLLENLIASFPPGTQLKTLTIGVPEVRGLASAAKLMLVSRSPSPVSLSLVDPNVGAPQAVTLAPYEVRFITR